jgi:hypothetical protein
MCLSRVLRVLSFSIFNLTLAFPRLLFYDNLVKLIELLCDHILIFLSHILLGGRTCSIVWAFQIILVVFIKEKNWMLQLYFEQIINSSLATQNLEALISFLLLLLCRHLRICSTYFPLRTLNWVAVSHLTCLINNDN